MDDVLLSGFSLPNANHLWCGSWTPNWTWSVIPKKIRKSWVWLLFLSRPNNKPYPILIFLWVFSPLRNARFMALGRIIWCSSWLPLFCSHMISLSPGTHWWCCSFRCSELLLSDARGHDAWQWTRHRLPLPKSWLLVFPKQFRLASGNLT